jgi:hypothetical protein
MSGINFYSAIFNTDTDTDTGNDTDKVTNKDKNTDADMDTDMDMEFFCKISIWRYSPNTTY